MTPGCTIFASKLISSVLKLTNTENTRSRAVEDEPELVKIVIIAFAKM